MPLKNIFALQPDMCVSAKDVREVICCLKDKMAEISDIATHPDFITFTPDAIIKNKYDGDFVSYEELKQVRCCINDFLTNFNLTSGNIFNVGNRIGTAAPEIVLGGYATGFNPSPTYLEYATGGAEISLVYLSVNSVPIVSEPIILGSYQYADIVYADRGYGLGITNVVDLLNNSAALINAGLEFIPIHNGGNTSKWGVKYKTAEKIRVVIYWRDLLHNLIRGYVFIELDRNIPNYVDGSILVNNVPRPVTLVETTLWAEGGYITPFPNPYNQVNFWALDIL